jgi:hypothetical protein
MRPAPPWVICGCPCFCRRPLYKSSFNLCIMECWCTGCVDWWTYYNHHEGHGAFGIFSVTVHVLMRLPGHSVHTQVLTPGSTSPWRIAPSQPSLLQVALHRAGHSPRSICALDVLTPIWGPGSWATRGGGFAKSCAIRGIAFESRNPSAKAARVDKTLLCLFMVGLQFVFILTVNLFEFGP